MFPPWSNNGTIITVVAVTRNSKDFLQQNPIKQALRIHYGWESEEHLQDITTEAFMVRLGGESFARERELYFVSSIHLQSRDDLEDDEIQVTATFYNPDIMFADFILVETDEGKYLIEDIQFDK